VIRVETNQAQIDEATSRATARRLHLGPLLDYVMGKENTVYELAEGEQDVGCYHCIAQGCDDRYGKGQAFLAGPGHTPLDGNANYICREHLDADAVIWSK